MTPISFIPMGLSFLGVIYLIYLILTATEKTTRVKIEQENAILKRKYQENLNARQQAIKDEFEKRRNATPDDWSLVDSLRAKDHKE